MHRSFCVKEPARATAQIYWRVAAREQTMSAEVRGHCADTCLMVLISYHFGTVTLVILKKHRHYILRMDLTKNTKKNLLVESASHACGSGLNPGKEMYQRGILRTFVQISQYLRYV